MAPARSRSPSPKPSQLPPVPSSPTYSFASTAQPLPSALNLPLPPAPRPIHAVLTKADLESSSVAYTELLQTAKAYRLALASLSVAASEFGSALETCARLKEARSEAMHPPSGSLSNSFTTKGACTADNIMAASGMHQLVANHQQILSECVYRNFEVPLLHEVDQWNRHMEEEEVSYQREARAMSKDIQRMEKAGFKIQNQRKRDVAKLRKHLVDLTTKLDGLTTLHGTHARTMLRDSQETSLRIVEASGSLVRAEVDIFEALARKGWTGGGLDELLECGQDIFAADAEGDSDAHNPTIFSILPQKSILADTAHDPASSAAGISGLSRGNPRRSDSLLSDSGDRYQSLAGAIVSGGPSGKDTDARSIFSDPGTNIGSGYGAGAVSGTNYTGILNRSRGVRPFSPPPPMVRVEDPLEIFGREEEEIENKDEPKVSEDVNEENDRGREEEIEILESRNEVVDGIEAGESIIEEPDGKSESSTDPPARGQEKE